MGIAISLGGQVYCARHDWFDCPWCEQAVEEVPARPEARFWEPPVALNRYVPVGRPEADRWVIVPRGVLDVFQDLQSYLRGRRLEPEEYFCPAGGPDGDADYRSNPPFPQRAQVACFAVTGASEGHYIHIGAILRGGQLQSLYLGKTFQGWDFAWRVARACAEALGA